MFQGLLVKLNRVGITGRIWRWLQSFFRRPQGFYNNAKCTRQFETRTGLPHGAVISPLLFHLYISDIFPEVFSNKVKFADDGTILCSGPRKDISKV